MDDTRAPTALYVGRALYGQILVHMAAPAPLEGVGLLAVSQEATYDRATRFYPGTNVDASPTRYTMEPAEVLAAFRDIEANGWRFGAIVHSHPATPPVPSATDLREAYYPDALLVIVGLAERPPVTRVWRLAGAEHGSPPTPIEVPLVVDEGHRSPRTTRPSGAR